MTIEKNFNVSMIAAMALKEKQIQQNYRPIIAVHKWFARRPGTLFCGLLLSEFSEEPLADTFFRANDFPEEFVGASPRRGEQVPLALANGCAPDSVSRRVVRAGAHKAAFIILDRGFCGCSRKRGG